MSKITTVINMMEQMKEEDSKKMHIKGELTSGDEVLLTDERDIEKGHHGKRGHDFHHHDRQRPEGREGHEKGRRPDRFGKDENGGRHNEEEFMNKLKGLGFSEEELEKLKASKKVFMKNHPRPKDRMITGLKLLDKMEESVENGEKHLKLAFTKEDMPKRMKEMKKAMKDQSAFAKKLRVKAEDQGDQRLIQLADRMDKMTTRPHMLMFKETLAGKGIDIEKLEFEKGNMIATIDTDNKLKNVIWTAELKDDQGIEFVFQGEGQPA